MHIYGAVQMIDGQIWMMLWKDRRVRCNDVNLTCIHFWKTLSEKNISQYWKMKVFTYYTKKTYSYESWQHYC